MSETLYLVSETLSRLQSKTWVTGLGEEFRRLARQEQLSWRTTGTAEELQAHLAERARRPSLARIEKFKERRAQAEPHFNSAEVLRRRSQDQRSERLKDREREAQRQIDARPTPATHSISTSC